MRTAVLTLLAVAGCTPPGSKSALDVTVRLAAGATSKCVKVIVQTDTGVEKSTGPMRVTAGDSLRVAVFRDSLPATVSVQAQGYGDDTCTARTVPAEESTLAAATFQNGVTPLELLVEATAAVDGDGDGYSPPGDCNDADPTIKPNAPEVCADGSDNDCDGNKDCADPDCHMRSCGGGATCSELTCKETNCFDGSDGDNDQLVDCADSDCAMKPCGTGVGASCQGGACVETACGDTADNNLNNGSDCFDPACLWQTCSATGKCDAGLCVEPSESICGDNMDNDGDSRTDCDDVDCQGKACDDGNKCTDGETCAAGNQCRNGVPKQCTAGPGQCFDAVGMCNPSTGQCQYSASAVDAGCDDTNPCTVADRCNGMGQCLSAPQVCASRGPCFSPGVCEASLDGGCAYAVLSGEGCNDGNPCTVGDACGIDGGCLPGPATSCTPPECKAFSPGNCDGAGACIFTNAAPNTPCGTGGFCDGTGTCRAGPTFPFTADNIVPTNHPPPAASATVIDCVTVFVSGPDAGFVSPCPGMQLPAISTADGGAAGPLRVLSFNNLFIADAGLLRLTGDYPVVLLVWGDAGINGPVLANSVFDAGLVGPGAAPALNCGARTGDGGVLSGGGGGGGYAFPGGDGGTGGTSNSRGGSGGQAVDGGDAPLLIGCPGGSGADSVGVPVPPGRGGGALQVVVAGGLTVNAIMSVSGSGGAGGFSVADQDPGGGGGGSGGTLLIQAQLLTITSAARLTSNGGGGGGGASSNTAGPGVDGPVASATPAPGGAKEGMNGALGGVGGAGTAGPGAGGSASKGGGGGGGSTGKIFLKQMGSSSPCVADAGVIISPPAVRSGCP